VGELAQEFLTATTLRGTLDSVFAEVAEAPFRLLRGEAALTGIKTLEDKSDWPSRVWHRRFEGGVGHSPFFPADWALGNCVTG
jgi:hypothetical protein